MTRLSKLAKLVRRLPVLGDVADKAAEAAVRVLEVPTRLRVENALEEGTLGDDLVLERRAAELGMAPKRCGLCRRFNLAAGQDFLNSPGAVHFKTAIDIVGPDKLGAQKLHEPVPIPAGALAVRPNLTRRIDDWGLCKHHERVFWQFEELPPVPSPDDPPCKDWL